MAKKSSIEKNNRRARVAQQFAARRAKLKAMAIDENLPAEDRFAAGEQRLVSALFDQAAALLQPSGLFGIDATLIDRALLRDAVNDPEWSEDARWSSDGRGVVRRESRLLPDPARRPGHAQLQIRHWHDGDSVPDQRDPFPIRAWQPAEIARIAERAGLRLSRPAAHDRLRWLLRSGHV